VASSHVIFTESTRKDDKFETENIWRVVVKFGVIKRAEGLQLSSEVLCTGFEI
jgi:hypothetical protein